LPRTKVTFLVSRRTAAGTTRGRRRPDLIQAASSDSLSDLCRGQLPPPALASGYAGFALLRSPAGPPVAAYLTDSGARAPMDPMDDESDYRGRGVVVIEKAGRRVPGHVVGGWRQSASQRGDDHPPSSVYQRCSLTAWPPGPRQATRRAVRLLKAQEGGPLLCCAACCQAPSPSSGGGNFMPSWVYWLPAACRCLLPGAQRGPWPGTPAPALSASPSLAAPTASPGRSPSSSRASSTAARRTRTAGCAGGDMITRCERRLPTGRLHPPTKAVALLKSLPLPNTVLLTVVSLAWHHCVTASGFVPLHIRNVALGFTETASLTALYSSLRSGSLLCWRISRPRGQTLAQLSWLTKSTDRLMPLCRLRTWGKCCRMQMQISEPGCRRHFRPPAARKRRSFGGVGRPEDVPEGAGQTGVHGDGAQDAGVNAGPLQCGEGGGLLLLQRVLRSGHVGQQQHGQVGWLAVQRECAGSLGARHAVGAGEPGSARRAARALPAARLQRPRPPVYSANAQPWRARTAQAERLAGGGRSPQRKRVACGGKWRVGWRAARCRRRSFSTRCIGSRSGRGSDCAMPPGVRSSGAAAAGRQLATTTGRAAAPVPLEGQAAGAVGLARRLREAQDEAPRLYAASASGSAGLSAATGGGGGGGDSGGESGGTRRLATAEARRAKASPGTLVASSRRSGSRLRLPRRRLDEAASLAGRGGGGSGCWRRRLGRRGGSRGRGRSRTHLPQQKLPRPGPTPPTSRRRQKRRGVRAIAPGSAVAGAQLALLAGEFLEGFADKTQQPSGLRGDDARGGGCGGSVWRLAQPGGQVLGSPRLTRRSRQAVKPPFLL
uniref:F-box domain-containing protein n=1 Tax=Macrostomum lignano TaxID=282301 RepID=A0A1I8JMW4_9PLAT